MKERIGENLKRLRIKSGKKQSEAAKEIGVTQGAICLWESGLSSPKAETLPKIAKAYSCEIADIYA